MIVGETMLPPRAPFLSRHGTNPWLGLPPGKARLRPPTVVHSSMP